MLFLLLKFLYIIILAFIYGHTVQHFLLKHKTPAENSFALTALTGIFWLSVTGAIFTLFIPLGALAHGIIAGGALLAIVLQRKSLALQVQAHIQQVKNSRHLVKAVFIIAVCYACYLSSLQSYTYDEGLYYAQFIKWMQAYKVVPGLANLHVRFGFNSHWHIIAALFNFSWLNGTTSNHINGALYLLVTLYLLPRKDDNNFILLLKAGMLIMINMPQLCVYNIIAPAADLPVYYIGCLVALLWLENNPVQSQKGLFLITAPLFLVTVKVSAVPILLLTLILFIRLLKTKQAFLPVIIGVIFFVPWLARNIILTGYPLFPMEMPDFFHLDWRTPISVVHATKQDITAFAFYRSADIQHLLSDTVTQRFKTWFLQHMRSYDQLLVMIALLSPVVVLIRRKLLPPNFLSLYIFLLLGCCFWIIQAPDPRFGYSYLAPLLVLTAALCFPLHGPVRTYITGLLSFVIVLCFQAGTIMLHKHLRGSFVEQGLVQDNRHSTFVMPAAYGAQPVAPQSNTMLKAFVPVTTELCWDNPLPCADHLPAHVTMRGNTLAEGFRAY